MRAHHLLSLLCLVGAPIIAACATGEDDIGSDEGAIRSDPGFYGDDRVGTALKGHPEQIPATFEDFEEVFSVGRNCKRANGKEIYTVEERQTRLALDVAEENMHDLRNTKLMPRFVIGGCNTGNTSDPKSLKNSYSLFAALISDPKMKGADQGDTVRLWPVEVMALDNTTGLYNFYVFEPAVRPTDIFAPVPKKTPGKVTRIFRAKEDRSGKANQGEFKVFQQRLEPGKPVADPVQPAGGGNRCFNCHVNGAPLMNEMHEPWTNWVSPKKRVPTTTMSGATQQLVALTSMADQLEGIITAGTDAYVSGAAAKDGWVNRTRDGLLGGGVPQMLKSLFCETELNYTSSDTRLGIPTEVFFDPAVVSNAGLAYPTTTTPTGGAPPFPFLFPIRSAHDAMVENVLVKRGYLTDGMKIAIRLVDDENDIFSPTRCGLLTDVNKELNGAVEPDKVKATIRSVLERKAPSLGMKPARLEYFSARLAGTVHQKKQEAYNAELQGRLAELDTSTAAIAKRDADRKKLARAMFDNPRSNPRPILDFKP
jgi:hypothetical protein